MNKIKKKIEQLRDILNTMICSDNCNPDELVKKSQELDKLILEAVKRDIYVKNVFGGELMGEFDTIVDKIQLFEKIYDSMRIVDPVKKEVLELKKDLLSITKSQCYEFWEKDEMCENCISMRAYNEDDTFIKMEHKGNRIFLITAVPICIHGKRLVVELLKDTSNNMYLQNKNKGYEVKMLSAIEHMNQAAVKDELTDLYNRRFIDERLPVDLLKSSLRHEPLSIIFADLDFFKSVNDKYGHLAGDHVLREFADELKRHIRRGLDWAARYGGEEFLICLANTGLDAAGAVAERIRKSFIKKAIHIGSEIVHVTASFGLHTVCGEHECLTVDSIIEKADRNLYKAKEEGRNRVV